MFIRRSVTWGKKTKEENDTLIIRKMPDAAKKKKKKITSLSRLIWQAQKSIYANLLWTKRTWIISPSWSLDLKNVPDLHFLGVKISHSNIIRRWCWNFLLDVTTSCKDDNIRTTYSMERNFFLEERQLQVLILPFMIFQDKVVLGYDGSSIHSIRLSVPAGLDNKKRKQIDKWTKDVSFQCLVVHINLLKNYTWT